MVLNHSIVIQESKWQNDFISSDTTFWGFADSKIQNQKQGRVLTAYYCFPDMHHYTVKNLEVAYEDILYTTIDNTIYTLNLP